MSTETAEHLREQYLTAPGDGLILTEDVTQFTKRCEQFLHDTGLDVEDIVITPVAGYPIPQNAKGTDGKMLKWEDVNPRMMWHPFFWLPQDIALRYEIQEDEHNEHTTHIETDDEWALRVIASCTAAGIYDPETGTWLNVLAWAGLNPEDAQTQQRIQEWLAGEDDHDLDNIDLTPLFEGLAEEVGLTMVGETPIYIAAQWAATATQISAAIKEALETPETLDDYPAEVVANYAFIGYSGNPPLPGGTDTTVQDSIREALQAYEDEQIDKPTLLTVLQQMSEAVFKTYEPFLTHVANMIVDDMEQYANGNTETDEPADEQQ